MKLDYRNILDFIFPPSDDELLIRSCEQLEGRPFDAPGNIIALTHYDNKFVKAAVHLNKFHHQNKSLQLLSTVLHTYLSLHSDQPTIVIPVPLSQKRLHKRGYNQVEEVARRAAGDLHNVTVMTDILVKHKHTEPQTSYGRKERLTNVKDAFSIRNKDEYKRLTKHNKIILLDDVTTTGATLSAAKAALLGWQRKAHARS